MSEPEIDWYKEVTASPEQPAAASTDNVDWYKEVTSQPQAEMRASPTNDKSTFKASGGILDKIEYAAPNMVIARASLATTPEDQIKRYAEYFNAPTKYFGVVNGEIVRWVPQANAYAKVVPTMGGQSGVGDTAQAFLSQWAAASGPAAPQIAGMATGMVMGPTGASIPAAGVAAGLTDWARQALDKTIAGEPLNPFDGADYDYGSMAGEATKAATGQAISVGISKFLTSNPAGIEAYDRTVAMNQVDQAKWQALEAEAEKRGITLSTGQKTGLRSLMAKERQLSRWNETADTVAQFRDQQWRGDVPNAFYDEVGKTAPISGREAMISSFREGADDVIAQAQKTRAAEASRAYGAAYEAYPVVDSPVLRDISHRGAFKEAVKNARRIADAKGQVISLDDADAFAATEAELNLFARDASASGKVPNPKGGVSFMSLTTWDRVKRGLQDMIDGEYNPTTGKLSAYGQSLLDMKREMVNELDNLTGGPNGLYGIARRGYAEGSEAVDQALEGGVGFIQKMKGLDRVGMVERIFSGRNILPEEISRTRELFEKAGQLDAWNNGLAAHLSQTLDDSIKSAGMSGNVPGQIYSRLGRDRLQHDTIVAAMGKTQGDSFEKFLDVLHAASRSLPEGSPTATDLGAAAGEFSGKIRAVGQALSPSSYFDAGNTVIKSIENLREPAARIKLAEYLLSKDGMKAVSEFKALSPSTEKGIIALSNVLTNAGVAGAKELTGIGKPRNRLPEIGPQDQEPIPTAP